MADRCWRTRSSITTWARKDMQKGRPDECKLHAAEMVARDVDLGERVALYTSNIEAELRRNKGNDDHYIGVRALEKGRKVPEVGYGRSD